MTDDELIDRYIVPDPRYAGPGDVRLRDSGIHVWAVIGQLAALNRDEVAVARDYGIPIVEVQAARGYYLQNRGAIESRLAANGEWTLEVQIASALPS
jgi:uncharacterized protein (DUF433 family)